MVGGEANDQLSVRLKQVVNSDDDSVHVVTWRPIKGPDNIILTTSIGQHAMDREGVSGLSGLFPLWWTNRIAHVEQNRKSAEVWNELFENFHSFSGQLGHECAQPGDLAGR